MEIESKEITVRELTDGYKDNLDEGVVGYGGKLDIRPPYQRNFIYKEKQRNAVIQTVRQGFPLNLMYWAVRSDGTFEIIDGQQRTISICQYVHGDFSVNELGFENLTDDQQEQILNYKLEVKLCSGKNSEKLEWFKTINIAGERLSDQEMRNAVYHGVWVSDAKRYFSRPFLGAAGKGAGYFNAKVKQVNRQGLLELAIKWISKGKIEDYMSEHQHDPSAGKLKIYFNSVIDWIETVFIKDKEREKYTKHVDWGPLYDEFKDRVYDANKIEAQVADLMDDDEVENKSGIYPYILKGHKRFLNLRTFDEKIKRKVYKKQEGICVRCENHFELDEMEADHITPWSEGGKTVEANCQMLCRDCNRRKSNN